MQCRVYLEWFRSQNLHLSCMIWLWTPKLWIHSKSWKLRDSENGGNGMGWEGMERGAKWQRILLGYCLYHFVKDSSAEQDTGTAKGRRGAGATPYTLQICSIWGLNIPPLHAICIKNAPECVILRQNTQNIVDRGRYPLPRPNPFIHQNSKWSSSRVHFCSKNPGYSYGARC